MAYLSRMNHVVLALVLSSLLAEPVARHVPAKAAKPQAKQMAEANRPVRKLGRWINRRTRPLGKVRQKVTPFGLVKYQAPPGCHRCFTADTCVSLPGGLTCAISELRQGQVVLGWNALKQALDTARVEALATVVHDSLRCLAFADGRRVTATVDHPFWLSTARWASLAPALTTTRYATGTVALLQPGDSCLLLSGLARLTPTRLCTVTTLTQCGVATYTITRLSRGRIFFANGLAVGVEEDKPVARQRRRVPSALVSAH